MKKRLFVLILVLACLTGCSESTSVSGEAVKKAEDYKGFSTQLQGWGFRRGENGPEFTKEQIKQMLDFGCIYRENTDEKNIYLTFDEGYENGYTSIILDVLRQKDVKAAFFVTGPYVKQNPDLIKRMADEGHIIGNHTVNHPSLPTVSDNDVLLDELYELDRLVYAITGEKCKYLRPPKGEYSEKTLSLTHDAGYINVFWSQAYVDWNNDVDKKTAFEKITKDLHPGCVLLLHAVSKGNAEALGDVIDYSRKEGYSFKNLENYIKKS